MSDLSERLRRLSPAKRALLDARIEKGRGHMVPIAIIGVACRFPGASGPEEFWQLLRNGVDAITEVPKERWDVEDFYSPTPATPGKMSTRWGGFLKQVDRFD